MRQTRSPFPSPLPRDGRGDARESFPFLEPVSWRRPCSSSHLVCARIASADSHITASSQPSPRRHDPDPIRRPTCLSVRSSPCRTPGAEAGCKSQCFFLLCPELIGKKRFRSEPHRETISTSSSFFLSTPAFPPHVCDAFLFGPHR